ncbi:MAG: hypothetical protein ACREFX_04260 [Opitutaceae bacterium]
MPSAFRSAFINPLMVYTLVGLGFSGSVGLGAVWTQHQISQEARRDHALEDRIDAAQRKSEELTMEIAREQDPDALLRRNAEWKLGLVPPAEDRVQTIARDPVQYLMERENSDLFEAGAPAAPRLKPD